jgi:hypothetical protein
MRGADAENPRFFVCHGFFLSQRLALTNATKFRPMS